MVNVTVTRTWHNAFAGWISEDVAFQWSFAVDVYCPSCGSLTVWLEESGHYEEDNAGGCYLCATCGHSFHYSGPEGNYISDVESVHMLAAVRSA